MGEAECGTRGPSVRFWVVDYDDEEDAAAARGEGEGEGEGEGAEKEEDDAARGGDAADDEKEEDDAARGGDAADDETEEDDDEDDEQEDAIDVFVAPRLAPLRARARYIAEMGLGAAQRQLGERANGDDGAATRRPGSLARSLPSPKAETAATEPPPTSHTAVCTVAASAGRPGCSVSPSIAP